MGAHPSPRLFGPMGIFLGSGLLFHFLSAGFRNLVVESLAMDGADSYAHAERRYRGLVL